MAALAVLLGWTVPAGLWLLLWMHIPAGLLLILGGGFPLVLFFPMRYRLEDEVLAIRSGLFRWRIPYPLITSVSAVKGVSAAPALSRDRLAIDFWTGEGVERVLVSPSDRQGFLFALRRRTPDAEWPETLFEPGPD